MNDAEPSTQIRTPLYLITSSADCWKCHRPQPVICLATYFLRADDYDTLDDDTEKGEPFLLSNVREMPEPIAEYLATAHPRFRPHHSRMADATYYANLCECGANFGDFYLHCEPEGAFFPTSEEQAATMNIAKLPFEGIFDFKCSWGQGGGHLIFVHATRVPPGA